MAAELVRMSFERLKVYQAAILFDEIILDLIKRARPGHSKDLHQLKDASGSGRANIAEAFGSEHPGQKIYHLGKSRGSYDEARDWLKRLVAAGAFEERDITRAVPLSVAIAKMLTAWIESVRKTA